MGNWLSQLKKRKQYEVIGSELTRPSRGTPIRSLSFRTPEELFNEVPVVSYEDAIEHIAKLCTDHQGNLFRADTETALAIQFPCAYLPAGLDKRKLCVSIDHISSPVIQKATQRLQEFCSLTGEATPVVDPQGVQDDRSWLLYCTVRPPCDIKTNKRHVGTYAAVVLCPAQIQMVRVPLWSQRDHKSRLRILWCVLDVRVLSRTEYLSMVD